MPFQLPFRASSLVLAGVVVGAVGAGAWLLLDRGKPARGSEVATPTEPNSSNSQDSTQVRVEVVHPSSGGVKRTCTQPGTVEPFQWADIFAKASGFLAEQNVDIGSRVKEGELIARIYVPEYEKHVQRDTARLKDAQAKVKQMNAHLKAAEADAMAADASVKFAEVLVKTKTSFRKYREKQLKRIRELVRGQALDERTADEQEDYYQSAFEAENAALEAVNTAKQKATSAHAMIIKAQADVEEAQAAVGIAEAELANSKVLLDYTYIRSPYSGVVTRRTFNLGDFIKSADQGGNTPLLTVERTDLMRVVVQVPDADVPYVSLGDPAVITIDALPDTVIQTGAKTKIAVSRWAKAEDPATRTMRTEIDVPNPDTRLRHGMYGHVTIILDDGGSSKGLRVPSAALVGKADGGRGSVRVVRDGKVRIIPVQYTSDNGVVAEIVSGLAPSDDVIVQSNAPIEDGTSVTIGSRHASSGQ